MQDGYVWDIALPDLASPGSNVAITCGRVKRGPTSRLNVNGRRDSLRVLMDRYIEDAFGFIAILLLLPIMLFVVLPCTALFDPSIGLFRGGFRRPAL